MTPEQLITFSHVAEHLNISRAARTLHLSQPAVSGQLQALQTSFGEPLYRRQGRGIALTPAGARLVTVANLMRGAMRQALDQREAAITLQSGHLRIGASTTPASYLLPEIVATFRRRYPGVNVQMTAGNTQEILSRLHELDLAVVEGEIEQADLSPNQVFAWQEDEVVAVLRHDHPLAKRQSLSLQDLVHQSLVMREMGSGVRSMVVRAFESAGLKISGYLELAGVEGVKQGVRAGLGVGFVSHLSLHHEDGSLAGIRIGTGLMRVIRVVVTNSTRLPRCAAVFLSQLKTNR
jgi:DNA-binding transcriptional LysR family regulator